MEEKRNFVGLRSFKKSSLQPFIDVKDDNECTQSIALANAIAKKQIMPLIVCTVTGREGFFIIDGVQRWKLVGGDTSLRCYYLGELEEEDALEAWFMAGISVNKNIVKMMDVILTLTHEQIARFEKVSKYTAKDFAHFKAMGEFNFEKYLDKVQLVENVQMGLFD